MPDGDVLVVAGDFSETGKHCEVADFAEWLKQQPHRHKVVIAGAQRYSVTSPFNRARLSLFLVSFTNPLPFNRKSRLLFR